MDMNLLTISYIILGALFIILLIFYIVQRNLASRKRKQREMINVIGKVAMPEERAEKASKVFDDLKRDGIEFNYLGIKEEEMDD